MNWSRTNFSVLFVITMLSKYFFASAISFFALEYAFFISDIDPFEVPATAPLTKPPRKSSTPVERILLFCHMVVG